MNELAVRGKGHLISPPRGYDRMPDWLKPRYLLKRIDEPDIELSLEQRNGVANAMVRGDKVIFIGQSMIATFNIKSMDPIYGPDNIPPKPDVMRLVKFENGLAKEVESEGDLARLKLWEEFYG